MEKTFRIYGRDGHRNKESFGASTVWHFGKTENHAERTIEVQREDKTGTNEYVNVVITMDNAEDIYREMRGQLDDGIFENVRFGRVCEVIDGKEISIQLWE